MMDMPTQNRPQLHGLVWIALLACAAVVSPISIRIAIAQDGLEITVAQADPGQPPAPPAASAALSANLDAPVATVPPSPAAAEAAVSEISQESELGELAPLDTAARTDGADTTRTPASPDGVRTLSVEPGSRPILPADRPAWVGAAPDLSSAQHHLYVGSLPTLNESDADEALDEPLVAAVRNYIDQEVINRVGAADQMPVDADFIRRNLLDDPAGYVCELATSQGAMFQKWVTVRVTPEQRELFQQWHTEASQRARLAPLGLGLVSVLALVSLSHMVLRRRHGTIALPSVNQRVSEPPVAVRRSRSGTILKLMACGALLTLSALFFLTTRVQSSRSGSVDVNFEPAIEFHEGPLPREVHIPGLHSEVRIETLGGERTIILRD